MAVDSLTNMDKAGCTKQDRPSALERRTPPNADKSIWSQVLKINLVLFLSCFRNSDFAIRFLVINIPKYLMDGIFSMMWLLPSCKDKISRLDILSLKPEVYSWVLSSSSSSFKVLYHLPVERFLILYQKMRCPQTSYHLFADISQFHLLGETR